MDREETAKIRGIYGDGWAVFHRGQTRHEFFIFLF